MAWNKEKIVKAKDKMKSIKKNTKQRWQNKAAKKSLKNVFATAKQQNKEHNPKAKKQSHQSGCGTCSWAERDLFLRNCGVGKVPCFWDILHLLPWFQPNIVSASEGLQDQQDVLKGHSYESLQ